MAPRPDLGPTTLDVNGCGHIVRYRCHHDYHGRAICIREPTEEGIPSASDVCRRC